MPDIILYLLKANLAIILFYLGYRLFLRKLTFYTLNRIYLLFALLFSFTYPLVDLAGLFETPVQRLPGEVVYFIPDWERVPTTAFHWWPLLVGAIALGTVWFAIKFVIHLLSLGRVHGQSHAATWQWFRYRQVFAPIRPFSFWRNIYVNVHNHTEGELTEIFKHEQVHVRELHTADVLFAELCSMLCWFNPGMWLLRHAIRENLEFITDRSVLRSGVDKRAYQFSLLGVGRQLEAYPVIAQGFNFKNLKRRIRMMNKKRSSRLQLSRYLLGVPIIAVFALFFTMSRAAYLPEEPEHPNLLGPAADQEQFTEEPARSNGPVIDTIKLKGSKLSIRRVARTGSDSEGSPLMILDGKELEKGFDIRKIDANTIDRIEVLKDSSATAMYGSRGADGAVRLTTKAKAQKDIAKKDTTGIREIRVVGYAKKEELKGQPAAEDDFNGALCIIDGKESTSAALRKLSPDAIEAIRVWKGAEAIDKYGKEGKNGVIEVTTAKKN